MGLFDAILGNAAEVNNEKLQKELEEVLMPGENVLRGFKTFRDFFVFTEYRLILVDKQGLTGSKIDFHSVPYKSITQFSVETAGTFDNDCQLKIWISGSGTPIEREFKRGTNVAGLQKQLAAGIFNPPKK